MVKKQKPFGLSTNTLTYVALFVVILLGFILLVPKVTSTLFPWKRQMILNDFMAKTKFEKTISPQSFWEFREFYSPGYYTFNRNGLMLPQITIAEKFINIPFNNKGSNVFLSFTSPHLHSLEALVSRNSLKQLIQMPSGGSFLLSSENEMVWKDSLGNLYVAFVKPISEMKTANGYFDYNDADKPLVEGKYWFDITKIDGK